MELSADESSPEALWLPTAKARGSTRLVDIHRTNQHGTNRDLLPEGLHPGDHETVLQHRGNEQANDRAEDGAEATEERCTTNDNCGDHVQVCRGLSGDCRGAVSYTHLTLPTILRV